MLKIAEDENKLLTMKCRLGKFDIIYVFNNACCINAAFLIGFWSTVYVYSLLSQKFNFQSVLHRKTKCIFKKQSVRTLCSAGYTLSLKTLLPRNPCNIYVVFEKTCHNLKDSSELFQRYNHSWTHGKHILLIDICCIRVVNMIDIVLRIIVPKRFIW